MSLEVSKKADGSEPRTYKVTPLATEWAIRNRDWVEGNMKKSSRSHKWRCCLCVRSQYKRRRL